MNDDEEGEIESNDMISTSRRPINLPIFTNQQAESPLLSVICREDGVVEYAVASGNEAITFVDSAVPLQRYQVDFQISKVFWVRFTSWNEERPNGDSIEESSHFLCIVGRDKLVFYSTVDAHPYYYDVPFNIRNVYSSELGVLIERDWTDDEEYKKKHIEYVYLYSISHPLNELLPVIYKSNDSLTEWMFCWERDEVCIVGAVLDCLLVFDKVHQIHRIYRVRASSEREIRSMMTICERKQALRQDAPCTPLSIFQTDSLSSIRPRSVVTRSMTAHLSRIRTMADSPTGPPLHFSPMSFAGNSDMDSPASFRIRPLSKTTTPRGDLNVVGDADMDLLLAELCLECIWSEQPKADNHAADKVFISCSLLDHLYLNYIVAQSNEMRSIRLIHSIGSMTTAGILSIIPCKDACRIWNDTMTAVLDTDGSITMYSGINKMALLITPPTNGTLMTAGRDCFVIQQGNDISTLFIQPAFTEKIARSVFQSVLQCLPHEKAIRLMADYRCRPMSKKISSLPVTIHPEVHQVFRFVLSQCGFNIINHPKLLTTPSTSANDDDETDTTSKQRRPRSTSEENWRRVSVFGGLIGVREEMDLLGKEYYPVDVHIDSTAPLYSDIYTIFSCLHSSYEEWSLDRGLSTTKASCSYYLHLIASCLNLGYYKVHYEEEFFDCLLYGPRITKKTADELPDPAATRGFPVDRPFNVLGTIENLLNNTLHYQIDQITWRTSRFLFVLIASISTAPMPLVYRVFGKHWSRKLRLKAKEETEITRLVTDKLISRASRCSSLLQVTGFTVDDIRSLPPSIGLLIGWILLPTHPTSCPYLYKRTILNSKFPTMEEFYRMGRLRWPNDLRIENARSMLDSSRPVIIATHLLAANTDQERRDMQEIFLTATSIRYLSQGFGRGLFEFQSELACPTEPIAVPRLCLSARLYPSNLTYETTHTEAQKALNTWGEFYNGVSSGLRISDNVKLDSEYMMMCHSNDKLSAATSAGLLYGFGLNGHIVNMNMYLVHDLLASLDKFQSIALLLGFSYSKLGTRDRQIHKILTTHLPFLMGPTLLDMKIDPLIQTSAIMGLGLLFAETGHVNLVNKLINEIGKSPLSEEEPAPDRPAYKLCAGMAVGLICLGAGTEMDATTPPFVQPIPSIRDRLIVLLNGGPKNMCVFPNQPTEKVRVVNDEGCAQSLISNHVLEGTNVNVHLTGQSATIALALLYLQSNNLAVADALKLPDSILMLEQIRPDIIMSRVLARSVIMWDEIEPTEEWVLSMVPSIIMDYMKAAFKWGDDNDLIIIESEDKYWEELVDRETIAQVYLYCVTGACFAMSLKYSSCTHLESAKCFNVLENFHYVSALTADSRAKTRLCDHAGVNVTSLCSGVILTCMSLVMTGSGDLDALRRCRMWRLQGSVEGWDKKSGKHHEQSAAHEAIGLLFLGRGRYGFKRDKLSLALMMISFFPLSCSTVGDNKTYHQPLRFFWVRAVEPRLIVPICRSTSAIINCQLKIQYRKEKVAYLVQAPFLLPCIDEILWIELGGTDRETVRFDMNSEEQKKQLISILQNSYGRIPLSRTGIDLIDENAREMIQKVSIEEMFANINTDAQIVANVEWERVASHLSDPLSIECRPKNKLCWPEISAVPSLSTYLRGLQMEMMTSDSSELRTAYLKDVRFSSHVADYAGERRLSARIGLEADKIEQSVREIIHHLLND